MTAFPPITPVSPARAAAWDHLSFLLSPPHPSVPAVLAVQPMMAQPQCGLPPEPISQSLRPRI